MHSPLLCYLCQQPILINSHFYKLEHCVQNAQSSSKALITQQVCISCVTLRLTGAFDTQLVKRITSDTIEETNLQRCIYLEEEHVQLLPYFLTSYHSFSKESASDIEQLS